MGQPQLQSDLQIASDLLDAARQGWLFAAAKVWAVLRGNPAKLRLIGTSQQGLRPLIHRDGARARLAAAEGNWEPAMAIWERSLNLPPLSAYGLSPDQLRSWVEAYARELYVSIQDQANAPQAPQILLIRGYDDPDWDRVIEPGATEHLGIMAVAWSHASLRALEQCTQPPQASYDCAYNLKTFVVDRVFREEILPGPGSSNLALYPRLGLSATRAIELCDYWSSQLQP